MVFSYFEASSCFFLSRWLCGTLFNVLRRRVTMRTSFKTKTPSGMIPLKEDNL